MTCSCQTVSADDFERLIAAIASGHEADAQRMPDEASALRAMFAAYQRLKALGFREIMYCPRDGKTRQFIESGGTGVFEGYRDAHGVWLFDSDDLWPSDAVLFREMPPPASTAEAETAETHRGSVHGSDPGTPASDRRRADAGRQGRIGS